MKQPKLNIQPSTTQRIFDFLSVILVGFYTGYAALSYSNLPDKIPIHFNAKGLPDSYGSKTTMLLLVALGLLVFFLILFINRKPHTFNYPVKIDATNARNHYSAAMNMMSLVNLFCAGIFAYIIYMGIQTAMGKATGLGSSFLFVIFGGLALIIGYYLFQTLSNKRDTV